MSDSKTLSFTEFRARVGDLRGKEYWRSLEELSRSDVFDEFMHQEFPQQAVALDKGVDRRDFMKLMGASVAMAGLAACAPPGETIVPYVNQPESLIPGKPLFFASAMPLGGAATGVLVESHMNRPTKIEGNPQHPSSLGASDALMQAAVLGLYDPDRSQVVRRYGDTATWGDFIAALQPVVNAAKTNGAGLRILTQTITSPTLGAQIQALLAQYPGMKWHQWEAVNADNVREGGRMAFGSYVHTHYDFTKANVVVSLGSDFLGEGAGHLRYARDFMSRRKIRNGAKSMNRLYAIEGSMSNTGSVADHRVAVKPSQIEDLARQILAGQSTHPVVQTLIKDLEANRGTSIVIAGDDQPAVVHAIAHAINAQLGNVGTTVLVTDPIEVAPVNQTASLRELVADMNAGRVNALLILGGNPVFDAPADLQFAKSLEKVPFRAHHSLYYDETSLLSHWHVPDTHWLESWGDARGHDGTISIIQPLIAPLYNGRSIHEVLGALIGGLDQTPYQTVRNHWFSQGATEDTWRKWLHDGVMPNTALPIKGGAASAPPATRNPQPATGIELELRHDPTIYDGRFANNSWLQELPKPQTKITWDNVLLVGPKTATKLGFDAEDRATLVNNKQTRFAELSYRGVTMRLPLWVVPGYAEDVATVYFGYGRRAGGAVATEKGKGFDTYPLRFSNALHGGPGAKITIDHAAKPFPVACTQEHQSIDPKDVGERGIIRSTTFEGYLANPKYTVDPHHGSGHDESITPNWDYSKQHAWAMVIDTSVCTGCNGCVAACQAENNIATVGKEEVVREREMHWLRIDRYYRGDVESPEVFHQPVPCMQCENAPCEPVCPVEATSHSDDGLNDMTYNRCVGTRYCSNNCPYKVRRFNFFHYADYDTPALKPMRNPDVTVRTRGVMEKCTYCVQRINAAKIEAAKSDRRVRDGEVVTACQQACPTQAIVFGDMNDPKSEVAQLKAQHHHYALLEELQTRPRTTYLGNVRNPHPDLATAHKGHES
ncbi:MAG TPA: TAT-variant-translocated molybdopterin oxidoreductase [Thermoanaerobaculia bacterium]|jgi:molybdopterin-containing oxidoreductase family iron-sulfur binding subunit|nr:TAT-variant-translocated molybdopterin oxidoreductase [Thermoanaerobaculia bacterium]